MKIGNVELKNNIFLAPMAGVTDKIFRSLCREQGCGLAYSEMISAKGILHNNTNTKIMLPDEDERPAVVQLFGSEPEIIAEAIRCLSDYSIDIFDINMGCPAPKIVKNGEGSALMQQPELIGRIVRAASDAAGKPVTIKIRKGFNSTNANAVDVAKIAEYNGASAVAVHGRTREQYYSGKADWDIIKQVKESVSIPVIGNGDIFSPEKAVDMLDYTGCDAVMMGRAAMGNPWIFSRTLAYMKDGEVIPEPLFDTVLGTALRHFKMLVDFKGEFHAIREIRKHMGWYSRGFAESAAFRTEINKCTSVIQLQKLIEDYVGWLQERYDVKKVCR